MPGLTADFGFVCSRFVARPPMPDLPTGAGFVGSLIAARSAALVLTRGFGLVWRFLIATRSPTPDVGAIFGLVWSFFAARTVVFVAAFRFVRSFIAPCSATPARASRGMRQVLP